MIGLGQTNKRKEKGMPKYQKFDGKLNLGGDLFEEARLRQGLSREEVAQRIRDYSIPMTRSGIYRIEKGQRRVNYYEYAALIRILKLDPTIIEGTIIQRLESFHRKNSE